MKKFTLIITAVAVLAGMSVNAADKETRKERRAERNERGEKAAKRDIDDHIRDINKLDNKESARLAGLRAVSKETAVPVPRLEEQLKNHPKAGIAGLLVANEIGNKTKKEPSDVFKAHGNGRSWAELAKEHSADAAAMEDKLSRVESAMRDAK
jgi:hypothetical protein